MYFKNQKFLVAGLSRSGEASAEFLMKRGAQVYIYDDVTNEKVTESIRTLEKRGAINVTSDIFESAVNVCDVLVLSPGIPIDNPLPVAFRRMNKLIIGEEELGALFLRAPAVAVTGTNGKTTTVSMIGGVLSACGIHCELCGNYGNPLVGEVENLSYDDVAVIEISSFQLETLSSLRPHVAVVTNITEDHLNRHYNMENYIFLKSKLVRNLRESEFAVLNYDDERVRQLADVTKAKVVYFSANSRVDGAYFENGGIYFRGVRYLNANDMILGGMHNVYNALACVAVAGILNLDVAATAGALLSFKGVKHRIELINQVNGVSYVDDSKGTNVDATLRAVQSMRQPTVLLLGGKDKGYDYLPLFSGLEGRQVIHTVLYGENRFKLLNAALRSGYMKFSLCENFTTAVQLSRLIARSGQCVLLSPASSSFDEFADYEERGDKFGQLVAGFADE